MSKLFIINILLTLNLASFAQVKVNPLEIKERILANGLRIATVQDKSNPVVTVQVWYRVGSKDDPQGRSGFAHMFEHMMFKATKNMPNEMMDRLTEDVGGFNNAFATDDMTAYYGVVPSNHLETLLWAEADRMVNLAVDKKNFVSERDVVKEEYRQSYEARPYGKLFWYLSSLSFNVHPYKRPTIGNLKELSAATIEDAFKFYRQYYRPDNAFLVVVGDFKQAQLDNWIDNYFGRIKKPDGKIQRVTAIEPKREKIDRYKKTRPNVPLPAIAITYFAPPSTSNDVPALNVAETILSDGRSSRLYHELIYTKQIARQASFFNDIRIDKGLLTFFAIAAGGKKLKDIESAFLLEIKKLMDKGPMEKELRKAKNKLVTDILQSRETVNGKAQAIGRALIYQNNPEAVNKDVNELESVTAEDVVRVTKKYFQDNTRAVIYYKNETEKGGKE